jgi:dolichol-phosphate mannosyltransferase
MDHQTQARTELTPAAVAPELTVIVPCFNERANVEPMIAALNVVLNGIAWEVLFVDDNSPDGTAALVKEIAARDPRIRCIRRLGRRGLSSAVIEGALASSAPYVAVIDGDMQHDEKLLPDMLAQLRSGTTDLVIGSRYMQGAPAGEGLSPLRQLLSDGGTKMAAIVLPVQVTDPMSGFFAVSRALFERAAPNLSGEGFKILVDLLMTARPAPRVVELPYTFRARHAGESKLSHLVIAQFGGLLLDKLTKGLVPPRLIGFGLVGALGIAVHLAVLGLGYQTLSLDFQTAQVVATLAAMTGNFALNNAITYRSERLRGWRWLVGLVVFYVVCSVGAFGNIGVANLVFADRGGWGIAGLAGAVIGVVWNYAVATRLVWRIK